MSFIEERLLAPIEYGFSGGPTWNTKRVGLKSGIIRRKIMRSRPITRLSGVFYMDDEETQKHLLGAFNACYGGAYSFRFKNFLNFELDNEQIAIGTGEQQSVQIVKRFGFGDNVTQTPIRKPNDDVIVTAGGVAIPAQINTTTGIATFTASLGLIVRVSGTFDTPVMFSNDDFVGIIKNYSQREASIELEEDLSA